VLKVLAISVPDLFIHKNHMFILDCHNFDSEKYGWLMFYDCFSTPY